MKTETEELQYSTDVEKSVCIREKNEVKCKFSGFFVPPRGWISTQAHSQNNSARDFKAFSKKKGQPGANRSFLFRLQTAKKMREFSRRDKGPLEIPVSRILSHLHFINGIPSGKSEFSAVLCYTRSWLGRRLAGTWLSVPVRKSHGVSVLQCHRGIFTAASQTASWINDL